MSIPTQVLWLSMVVVSVGCAASTPLRDFAAPPGPVFDGEEPQACTEIGCKSGLHIALEADAWPPGHYVFTVESDGGERTVCEGGLPLNRCELGMNLRCDAGDGPNPRMVEIGESGCALPAEQHRWGDIEIEGSPKEVRITIEHNGAEFAGDFFTPEYQVTRPNGPTCEPVCTQASVSIRIPSE